MRKRGGILLAIGALLAGCGGGAREATEKELSEMRSEIVKLRAEQGALAERLDAIQLGRPGTPGAVSIGGPQQPSSDRPDLEVVKLGPQAGGAGQDDDGGADDDGPRPVLRSSGSGVVADKGAKEKTEPDFDRGLELYKKKQYDKALEAFTALLVRSPDSSSADLATYYRGECLAAKSDWKRAAEQYEAVASSWPKSAKAADALLKLAQAQKKLGDTSSADETKKKLLATYPSSDAAKKLTTTGGKKP